MPNAHVAAAATGLPVACTPLATIRDCELVYAAFQNAFDAVSGVMARPGCQDGADAFSRLDALAEWLMAEADRAIHQAEAMTPKTRSEADNRALLLLQHQINCGSNPAILAALAATLTAERSRIHIAQH